MKPASLRAKILHRSQPLIGSWGNQTSVTSCALKKSTASKLGASPRCRVLLTWNDERLFLWWDSILPESIEDDVLEVSAKWKLPDYAKISVIQDFNISPASPLE